MGQNDDGLDGELDEADDEPSVGSLEGVTDPRRAWVRTDEGSNREMDPAENGIGDGALEQFGIGGWNGAAVE